MAEYSKEFLDYTIKVWQPYSEDPLTLDDAQEIAENMANLCIFLMDLEREDEKIQTKP